MAEDSTPVADPGAPEATESAPEKPARKPFRKRFVENRLAPDSAERQGRIARIAWEKLGGRDAAVAFLNTHDDALGGRPIDLAVASESGLKHVEQRLVDDAARED